jgi:hypothetical protein
MCNYTRNDIIGAYCQRQPLSKCLVVSYQRCTRNDLFPACVMVLLLFFTCRPPYFFYLPFRQHTVLKKKKETRINLLDANFEKSKTQEKGIRRRYFLTLPFLRFTHLRNRSTCKSGHLVASATQLQAPSVSQGSSAPPLIFLFFSQRPFKTTTRARMPAAARHLSSRT